MFSKSGFDWFVLYEYVTVAAFAGVAATTTSMTSAAIESFIHMRIHPKKTVTSFVLFMLVPVKPAFQKG